MKCTLSLHTESASMPKCNAAEIVILTRTLPEVSWGGRLLKESVK